MQLAFRDGRSRTGHASFLNSLELVLDGWLVPGLVPGTIVALFTSFSDSSRKRLPPSGILRSCTEDSLEEMHTFF